MKIVPTVVFSVVLSMAPFAPGRVAAASPATYADAHFKATESSLASFEDSTLDLSVSWGAARACLIAPTGNICFRSEDELDAFTADAASVATGSDSGVSSDRVGSFSTLSTCATPVKLWDNTGHTGTMVQITTRLSWVNLSSVGFSALTSSYQIGGCSSAFRDASLTTYPGPTSAGYSASSMVSTWDNRVTGVYIS